MPTKPLRSKLLTDSKALFETRTTLHTSEDYRLRATVARLRASFESKELNTVQWIPGVRNAADAMMKQNLRISLVLNEMIAAGTWIVDT